MTPRTRGFAPAALALLMAPTSSSIRRRWRWRGLGNVAHTRYVDANGNRVAIQDKVAVTVPGELSLEFVDADGPVLWTAPATTPARRSSPPPRRRR